MTQQLPHALNRRLAITTLAAAALLSACGGESPVDPYAPVTCSVTDQKAWLGSWMNETYFWYRLSPRPDAAAFSSVQAYFDALLYTGTNSSFPADRWSYTQSTEAFERFYGDGQTLGYGVSVSGVEVAGQPDQPLYVRYVEAASGANARGVQRGDRVMSVNGVSAATLIANDDYSVLTPTAAGQQINLVLRNTAGADRSVTLTASVYTLTPVSTTAVVTTPLGRKLGYVVVKDMISQTSTPLDNAFKQFKAEGVGDVVLDLRYNGGGLVSVGANLASYVVGPGANGQVYAALYYNDKQSAANNQSYRFATAAASAGVGRVFVLTGPRTCSASEQVINGLRGVGVNVVAIGDTTCGKPVGFVPTSQCGTTYAAVNFESVNALNQGRYFDGFAPTCGVAEDFTQPLGATAEPLLNAARQYADAGACPVSAGPTAFKLSVKPAQARRLGGEGDAPQGMWGR